MNDGDPVDCQYVGWIMYNYPSGSSSESGLITVLEEATRTSSDEPVYKNDKRYVHLWIEYANIVEQSESGCTRSCLQTTLGRCGLMSTRSTHSFLNEMKSRCYSLHMGIYCTNRLKMPFP